MKILVITHFYPPIRDGGYAQLCAEVCDGLDARHHEIQILTSRFEASLSKPVSNISRTLYLENDLLSYSPLRFFSKWWLEEKCNQRIVSKHIENFKPDLIFIWGMYGLSRSIPAICEKEMPSRVIYYISDLWPASDTFHEIYWKSPATSDLRSNLKQLVAPLVFKILALFDYPPKLEFLHAMVVSKAVAHHLKKNGLPFNKDMVVHSGIDPEQFYKKRKFNHLRCNERPIRVVYAGNLIEPKGVHTAIEAFDYLRCYLENGRAIFHVIGGGPESYIQRLNNLVNRMRLSEWIIFKEKIPREDMARILGRYDVIIVPSIIDDALPRIVQESMMSGLLVVGSNRGGIPEMIKHHITGVLFEAEDAQSLAKELGRIIESPESFLDVARRGQQYALKNFSIEKMIERIDQYLAQVANA